jgi:hypothetical protein
MHGRTLAPGSCRWQITDALVAGRRLSGHAWGRDAAEAVRHFAATQARELHVDVATAIATASRDPLKKVTLADDQEERHP